jgi:hypothetical protein
MADDPKEPKDRLVLARERAGYKTRADAIRAFRWNDNVYRSHENGQRGITRKRAIEYAKAYRVSHLWLLGESESGGPTPAPVNQEPPLLYGEDSEVDPYRMALALGAAQDVASGEDLPSTERQMRIVRLQIGIYRCLSRLAARGVEVNEEMARWIADLIREAGSG